MKKRSLSLILGIIILSLIVAMCLVSFFYMPFEPNVMDNANAYQSPAKSASLGHYLGTDQFGRDILSRIMYGSRTVLLIGFISVTGGALTGIILGSSAAIIKRLYGAFVMRAIDGLMAFPGTLLALMLVAVVGKGQSGAVLAISVYTIAPFARLIYTLILENESLTAIKAARSFGVNRFRLLSHYYLPMLLPKLLTQYSASVASAIMTEAALSFLGLGVQPPNASWGLMLSEAKQYALFYPYLALAPGIAIFAAVLGFNLLSDGLNDFLIGRRSDR